MQHEGYRQTAEQVEPATGTGDQNPLTVLKAMEQRCVEQRGGNHSSKYSAHPPMGSRVDLPLRRTRLADGLVVPGHESYDPEGFGRFMTLAVSGRIRCNPVSGETPGGSEPYSVSCQMVLSAVGVKQVLSRHGTQR
ncbi:hypothetical protein B7C42_07008 [Nocardia cerradoensis]|uniref:Uncharacterized protein n=1 Tax=Nocardia cerradoensis TaxID=85688 RepID=A0A231GW68_9NOCA|nr:hypothetical protein B7C42_07008 [Nocardia cerradoensis]